MADDPKGAARTALVTGAGRRIGAAIALVLARAGYAVVLHANNSRDDAEKLASTIMGAGGQARVVLADLADREAVRGLVPAAAAFGGLTLLVNNAGEFEPDDIETLSHARFQRAVAVNLEGRFSSRRPSPRKRLKALTRQSSISSTSVCSDPTRAFSHTR